MTDDSKAFLECCEAVLLSEIANPQIKQKALAVTYALAIRSETAGVDLSVNWKKVNDAIVERWSLYGLERVKQRAWDIYTGKIEP